MAHIKKSRDGEVLLPQDPSKMTFSGRYLHVDEFLTAVPLVQVAEGTKIRILDFGSGVLETGSPTAHDLYDTLTESGLVPEIVVVDEYMPDSFKPIYPDITYCKSLDGASGKFHIVRLLWVKKHISNKLYENIRKKLVSKVVNGGMFIVTQYFEYYHQRSDDVYSLPTAIKVMQKRGRNLVPISLLPDTVVPWNGNVVSMPLGEDGKASFHSRKIEEYLEFVKQVENGTRQLVIELNIGGYSKSDGRRTVIGSLKGQSVSLFQSESSVIYPAAAVEGNDWTFLETILKYQEDSAEWFLNCTASNNWFCNIFKQLTN